MGLGGEGKQDLGVVIYGSSLGSVRSLAPVSLSEEELFSGSVVWWLFHGLWNLDS